MRSPWYFYRQTIGNTPKKTPQNNVSRNTLPLSPLGDRKHLSVDDENSTVFQVHSVFWSRISQRSFRTSSFCPLYYVP